MSMIVYQPGMVFQKIDNDTPIEDYFIYDYVDPSFSVSDQEGNTKVINQGTDRVHGIVIGRDSYTNKFSIRRNVSIPIDDFNSSNWRYINEDVSLDGILLTGIIASLQLGIRK